MRLIDADKLYKRIKAEGNPYGKPSISFDDCKTVLDIISIQPTAYDIDKVVEEFIDASRETVDGMDFVETQKAIEIIKAGAMI